MEVAALYNQMNNEYTIQDHAASMNDKAIRIPKEVIWIEWVSLA